jgi:hypothetical protein
VVKSVEHVGDRMSYGILKLEQIDSSEKTETNNNNTMKEMELL